MKHLLTALASQNIVTECQDVDLRKLLGEVHKQRGEVKTGENWEDMLEKALTELRNSEYALAFLKPVKKSEAPDYDKVISKPMDLQTMGRKVKQHQYKSKKDFGDDLMLIWSNCFQYNTDPAHPLRRAATFMQKKTDTILRRLPERTQRSVAQMIDKFQFTPKNDGIKPKAEPEVHLNGTTTDSVFPPLTSESPRVNGDSKSTTTAPAKPDSKATTTPKTTTEDESLENRPALERTVEGMQLWTTLEAEFDRYLANWDFTKPLDIHLGPPPSEYEKLNQDLAQLVITDEGAPLLFDSPKANGMDIDMEDGIEDSSSDNGTKKRKRSPNMSSRPRKRLKLGSSSQDQSVVENWWEAVQTTDLIANAIPASFDSKPIFNPLLLRRPRKRDDAAMDISPGPRTLRTLRLKRKRVKDDQQAPTLFKMMGDTILSRRRTRALHAQISEQIEEAKQAVDPDEAPVIIPEPEPIPRLEKSWGYRAGLHDRRRQTHVKTEIGGKDAQDCMEWMTRVVLEHANFDSSSTQAVQALAGLASEALMNFGRTLQIFQETQALHMSSEEMVSRSLFVNGVGSMYDLEHYIKNDIIKNGSTMAGIESQFLAVKREEMANEDRILDNMDELTGGEWADYAGEDLLGLRSSGIAKEFGLVSLTVPKRLWRPKVKAAQSIADIGPQEDAYSVPAPFEPLETKRIDQQIGLLRHYYTERAKKLAPPPPPPRMPTPPPTPPPVVEVKPEPIPELDVVPPKEPTPPPPPPPVAPVIFDPYNPSALSIVVQTGTAAHKPSVPRPSTPTPAPAQIPSTVTPVKLQEPELDSNYPYSYSPGMMPMGATDRKVVALPPPVIELPPILPDDAPDPGRVKLGPIGQIQQIAAATLAKQKRQAAKAATLAQKAAGIPIPDPPPSATKPKKSTPKKPKKPVATAPPPVPPV